MVYFDTDFVPFLKKYGRLPIQNIEKSYEMLARQRDLKAKNESLKLQLATFGDAGLPAGDPYKSKEAALAFYKMKLAQEIERSEKQKQKDKENVEKLEADR